MNLNRSFTKRLRRFVVTLVAGLWMFVIVAEGWAIAPVSILDSLGMATPATQFPIIESSGQGVFEFEFAGPEFTLTQPTTLTEIGGFVNSRCLTPDSGEPDCTSQSPLIVQIRPSINGLPDASTVLASFLLSDDNEPLVVSYESVAINLTLQPGSYFALFVPQEENVGFLLSSATSPFNYQAGVINFGAFNPNTGDSVAFQVPLAVRILGETRFVLDGCNSEIPNIVLPGGSTISDLITECAEGAKNHGQFVSCVAHVTNTLKKAGTITSQQKGAIQRCAAQAEIP